MSWQVRRRRSTSLPILTSRPSHNALVNALGTWRGLWGGTVFIEDAKHRLVVEFDRDGVNDLLGALAKLDPS